MKNKIMIKSYASDMEVRIAQMKLSDANVDSWTIDKRDSTILTTALSIAGIELYVDAEQVEAARQLLVIDEEE